MSYETDWYTLDKPSSALVAQLADVPGLKWNTRRNPAAINGVEVASVGFHRSHWPLLDGHHGTCIKPHSRLSGNGNARILNIEIKREVALRRHQADGVLYSTSRRASILGFEMRLGKTLTAVAAHNPADGPLVIIAPLITRDIWRIWTERVHATPPVALSSKTLQTHLRGYPVYFVHFDVVDAQAALFYQMDIGTLVIDEIHLLQAKSSQRLSAASVLAARSKRIIGLSGTPMWSNPRSLWSILNLLSPGAWGTNFQFSQRYCNAESTAYGWRYSGINNADELRSRLSEVVLRCTWQDALGYLPPVTNTVEFVDVSAVHRKRIDNLVQKVALLAAAEHREFNSAGQVSTLRRLLGELKVKRAVELAEQAMLDGHKVVVWHWHNEVGEALWSELAPTPGFRLTAAQTQEKREEEIRWFQAEHKPCAMIVPLAVGGVGIDLSSADVNIFVEQDWIPATNYQAAMRVFKPSRPHANVWVVTDTPVERRLMEVLSMNEACQSAAGLGYDQVAEQVLSKMSAENESSFLEV